MAGVRIEVDTSNVQAMLQRLIDFGQNQREALKDIATYGEASTRERFKASAGPDGLPWKPSRRVKKKGGKTLIMKGHLLDSIVSDSSDDYAQWGTNRIYAAIHQFGGDIDRAAYSIQLRLRTDRKGNLLRQESRKNLAIFAKGRHKLARTVNATIGAHQITIPARPYLGINAADEASILDIINRHIAAAVGD